jgi:hypothetical protein
MTSWLGRKIGRLRGGTHLSSKNYADRVLKKLAKGGSHSTLGNKVHDETYTRTEAAKWLEVLKAHGLKPDMLTLEYGCGSLWAGEPVLEYLDADKFLGCDIVDGFYRMGLERIPELAASKRPRLWTISKDAVHEIGALRPRLIYSRKVLSHIAPPHRHTFLELLGATITPGALCLMDSIAPDKTIERNLGTWAHAIDDVRRDLPKGLIAEQQANLSLIRRAA